jgi:hypothetical protein
MSVVKIPVYNEHGKISWVMERELSPTENLFYTKIWPRVARKLRQPAILAFRTPVVEITRLPPGTDFDDLEDMLDEHIVASDLEASWTHVTYEFAEAPTSRAVTSAKPTAQSSLRAPRATRG